jgi:hypothetical protein
LERIDPDFFPCNNPGNWRASEDLSGGTPGRENSIFGSFTDDIPPSALRAVILGPQTIEVFFSEPLDPQSAADTLNYILDNGIGFPRTAFPVAPEYVSVILDFGSQLDTLLLYELSVTGISDCPGNQMDVEAILFGYPAVAKAGDLLINEILFNPFTGGSDFVEIYQAGSRPIDLSTIEIAEGYGKGDSVYNAFRLSDEPFLLLPGELICLTKDVAFQKAAYFPPADAYFLKMAGFPGYDDAAGECVILTDSGVVLDRFLYYDDFHYPSLVDDEGVSLERISLETPASDPFNWHSAAFSVHYATPGYANSQRIELAGGQENVWLEKETFSPNGDGEDDVLAIRYRFNFIGGNARISLYDDRGRKIRTLSNNVLLNPEEGVFFWDGTDDNGQKAGIGIYVVLVEVSNIMTGKKEVFKLACVLADRL